MRRSGGCHGGRRFWPGATRALCAGSLACLVSGLAAASQDAGFWSFLKRGQVLTLCAEGSDAHREARVQLEGLDTRISRLQPTDSPATAIEELHGLLKSECFWLAYETDRVPGPDSTLSLKAWWFDGGGREWLASYLELPLLGNRDNLVPHIVVPPDARTTLSLDANRGHPLQRLLCPRSDEACGAATRGWRLRAQAAFEAHEALGRGAVLSDPDDRPAREPADVSSGCAAATREARLNRYLAWRECVEARRPKRTALPLGDFKAPADGWLIVSGRRGHYSFCDTTRAYDLATGTAMITDSCSELVLRKDGHVDREATDRRRAERVAGGTVSTHNLREAVWMLLLRGEAERIQLDAAFYPLPAGLVPEIRVAPRQPSFDGGGGVFDTSQTLLTWRWVPASGSGFTGELTWPASYQAAEDHAVKLLEIAEESLVEGCVSEQVPGQAALNAQPLVPLDEVDADSMADLDRNLAAARRSWRALPACRPRPR